MAYFLATGNLVSPSGLDLQQTSGYTIVAEKLNFYRYLSHFRCIHRGAFFAELKTTDVRKLRPESWGECHLPLDFVVSCETDVTRLPLSRPHTRWIPMWSTQPLITYLQAHHFPSGRLPHTRYLDCKRYDPGLCLVD